MARIDDLLIEALKTLPPKPSDNASRDVKKNYSEKVSQVVAVAIAAELRTRGLKEARPNEVTVGDSGAERRMAGGLGAKKVDVTWATPESGLLLSISVKTINFKDKRSNNYQKNLTNRRGDMLMEAVTLHRRFPYAVIAAFFFLDKGAESDHNGITRKSTFENANRRLRLFDGRNDPAGRDEQFERFYLLLLNTAVSPPSIEAYRVGDAAATQTPLSDVFDDLLKLVEKRNSDFYEFLDGVLRRAK
ncbi:MAG: hypothetical protein LT106_11130 [Burkholderiaceae bacterium]|nr:hypothetical protein [Burkholderiaceae bacterium]